MTPHPRRIEATRVVRSSGAVVVLDGPAAGSILSLPHLSHHDIDKLGEVLLAFPDGFLLEFERDVVGEIDIHSVSERGLSRHDKGCAKLTRIVGVSNELNEHLANHMKARGHDEAAAADVVHDRLSVLVLPAGKHSTGSAS